MKNLFVIGILSAVVGLLVIIISLAAMGGLFTWAGILGIILLIVGIVIIRKEKNTIAQQSEAAPAEQKPSKQAPAGSPVSGRQELTFYDVKSKKKFKSSQYDVRQKSNRFFAVTQSPSGDYECWKIISNKKAAELRK